MHDGAQSGWTVLPTSIEPLCIWCNTNLLLKEWPPLFSRYHRGVLETLLTAVSEHCLLPCQNRHAGALGSLTGEDHTCTYMLRQQFVQEKIKPTVSPRLVVPLSRREPSLTLRTFLQNHWLETSESISTGREIIVAVPAVGYEQSCPPDGAERCGAYSQGLPGFDGGDSVVQVPRGRFIHTNRCVKFLSIPVELSKSSIRPPPGPTRTC